MCDEYFFQRRKASDAVRKSKEQVEDLLRQITATAAQQERQSETASEPAPTAVPEREPA